MREITVLKEYNKNVSVIVQLNVNYDSRKILFFPYKKKMLLEPTTGAMKIRN